MLINNHRIQIDTINKQEQALFEVLARYVETGSFSSPEELRTFESKWKNLSPAIKIKLGKAVEDHYLTQINSTVWRALDHSPQIMTTALAFLMIAGTGAYLLGGEPLTAILAGSIAGVGSGMLMLESYKNKYNQQDLRREEHKRERLTYYCS